MNDEKNIGGGLLASVPDERDFSFGAVFSLPALSELPNEYTVGARPIKNQYGSDLCSSFAATAVSEDQELAELSPEFQFAQTKKLTGDWQSWGSGLRDVCKSMVKVGSIPVNRLPDEFKLLPDNSNRNRIADWTQWPSGIELYATKYRKKSYFSVGGQYTTFDNFRTTLYQNRKEERSILTGVTWQQEWSGKSYIDKDDGHPAFGHAFKCFGFKNDYLICQLSNGLSVGENGIMYFHKNVVNKQFNYGGFLFMDLEREEAEWYIKKGVKKTDPWLRRLIISLFH